MELVRINYDYVNIIKCSKSNDSLNMIIKNNPDIIIFDIDMKIGNGLDLLWKIRNDNISNAKVIIITKYSSFEYAQRAIRLKIEDFLLKPINYDYFIESIKRVLESIDNNLDKCVSTKYLRCTEKRSNNLEKQIKFNNATNMDESYSEYIINAIIYNIYCENIDGINSIIDEYCFYLKRVYSQEEIFEIIKVFINSLNKLIIDIFRYNMVLKVCFDKFEIDKFSYIINDYCKKVIIYYVENTSFIVRKACIYIKNNFYRQITLNDVSQHLEVSYFHISKVLSTEYNIKISDMINNLRLQEAIKQLKTNKRIKEISLNLGFHSQNYFTKIFKKIIGMTPHEFRDRYSL